MCPIHVFEFDLGEAGFLAAAARPQRWAKTDNKHEFLAPWSLE